MGGFGNPLDTKDGGSTLGSIKAPGWRSTRQRPSMQQQTPVSGKSIGEKATRPAETPPDNKPPTRLGWLKNGNRPGRFSDARRCGARSKRTGQPCRAPACRGKRRCRLHGGRSTGPRTAEGLQRSRRARWKSGFYSRQQREVRGRTLQRARLETAAIMAMLRAARLGSEPDKT